MKITVIVCTYNRCKSLPVTLDSIAGQSFKDPVEWEVLVVNNNSNDETAEVVEDFSRRYPGRFRYLFEPRQGLSQARNAGVNAARGDILVFTDDDVTFEPGWLQNLTSELNTGKWAGAGGRILRRWTCPAPKWLSVQEPYERMSFPIFTFDKGTAPGQLDDFAAGANMAYRKEVFQKYGNFRTDLGRCGDVLLAGEEVEFARRVRAAGERLRYEPSAVVYHPVEEYQLSQKYFLTFWFDAGRSGARIASTQPVWGIPRRYFRVARMIAWLPAKALAWMLAVNPRRRFYYKVQVWEIAGGLVECIHQWRDAMQPSMRRTLRRSEWTR
ncbi:MAG TPA: glycosyltransferase family 2 protein [Candidatus Sulfotelmatobacter sp.]|nr:glycosyltransferase family 2 protein [Candidatus Sulfotelmatobacter sp.]